MWRPQVSVICVKYHDAGMMGRCCTQRGGGGGCSKRDINYHRAETTLLWYSYTQFVWTSCNKAKMYLIRAVRKEILDVPHHGCRITYMSRTVQKDIVRQSVKYSFNIKMAMAVSPEGRASSNAWVISVIQSVVPRPGRKLANAWRISLLLSRYQFRRARTRLSSSFPT